MTLQRLGARVGNVTVKIDMTWPMYEEHVDFLRHGSVLLLVERMRRQFDLEGRRQLLDQLRKLAHADGWRPTGDRDPFSVAEPPVEAQP